MTETKKNVNKPILTLNMDEKIYLAVAKTDLDKLSFVYTLACLKPNPKFNEYDLIPTREIHTFTDKESAKVYHDAIEQIIEFNLTSKMYQALFKTNDKLIESFAENIR